MLTIIYKMTDTVQIIKILTGKKIRMILFQYLRIQLKIMNIFVGSQTLIRSDFKQKIPLQVMIFLNSYADRWSLKKFII